MSEKCHELTWPLFDHLVAVQTVAPAFGIELFTVDGQTFGLRALGVSTFQEVDGPFGGAALVFCIHNPSLIPVPVYGSRDADYLDSDVVPHLVRRAR